MNKIIDKGFRSCRFVSTIVKHPVLGKQRSFTFTIALCLIKLLSSCCMLLDTEPKYGSCNEIYLGEREDSAGASRCCVTPHFLFRNC